LTDQTANARNRATVRIFIGVLIAMLGIYSATKIQPSLASGAFGILMAVLSLYLMASGIRTVSSSDACAFRHSDTVDKVHAETALTHLKPEYLPSAPSRKG
jgi:uncharacterized membrane protein YfcA